MKEAGITLLSEGVYVQYIPDQAELDVLAGVVEKIKETFVSS